MLRSMRPLVERLARGDELPLEEQAALVGELALANPLVPPLLDALSGLPDGWLGAGIIVQPVWNLLHGRPMNEHLVDVDVLYWDPDLSWKAEDRRIRGFEQSVGPLDLPLDVKNVARVHLWYEEKFGLALDLLPSVPASVATWPVLASCVALRRKPGRGKKGRLEFCAPYGFQDLFAQRLRPNDVLDIPDVYRRKVERWSSQWPELEVTQW